MTTTTKRRSKASGPIVPAMPLELAGLFRWDTHPNATGELRLQSAEFTTKWYYIADRAIGEAQRWMLSRPKAKSIEEQPTAQAIDAAADDVPPGGWGYHTLPIAQIRRDGGTQARVGLDEDTVKEYTEAMREQRWDWLGTLSRPIVCWDREGYWLADGFHRIEAGQRAGLTEYPVEVLADGKRAALLRAAGANANHGLRRTNADKRRAVELLLKDDEWGKWSDREIARRCVVSHRTVADTRADLESTGQISSSTMRQSADGKTRDVSGIAAANTERAQPTDDQIASMRQRFSALGYEQFYRSDAGWTAYHPKTKKANYKTWADVEADIARKEGAASMRCEACGKHWGAPGSMVTSEGRLCQDCAATRLSSGQPFAPGAINHPDGSPAPSASFWQSMSAAHPTAHLWTQTGMHSYRSACGMTAQRAPSGSPDAGHCSSCVKVVEARATPAQPPDHEIVATIRAKAAALGLELIWEDDEVILYWPDEVDDLDQMDGLSYELALEWLEGDGLNIAASRVERETTTTAPDDPGPHLPPPAEWKAAQQRARALGLRLDMTAHGAFSFYRLSDQGAAGGAVDWPAMLSLLDRKEVTHFAALCDRVVELGATVNPTAYEDAAYVQVIPPAGYTQTPLKLNAKDLAEKIAQWTPPTAWENQPAPPTTNGRSDWWDCGRELKSFDTALNSGDHPGAVRAAAQLTLAIAGDATRLALVQAEKAAETLDVYGYASLASFLRLLAPESEVSQ